MTAFRSCAACRFWLPTEMEIYRPHMQPHEAHEVAMQSEMLRATHALCTWPGTDPVAIQFLEGAPPWLVRRVGGGALTAEEDGHDCAAFEPRPEINLHERRKG